jgi:hypothetical protein
MVFVTLTPNANHAGALVETSRGLGPGGGNCEDTALKVAPPIPVKLTPKLLVEDGIKLN